MATGGRAAPGLQRGRCATVAIEATAPTAQEARLLGVARGTPCLVVMRRTVSRGLPVHGGERVP